MFGPVKWHHDSRTRNVPFKQPIGVEAVGKHPNPSSVAGKPIEDTGQTAPLEESQVAFPSWITGNNTAYSQLTGKTVPESGAAQHASLDYLNEDYRRDLSNLLGELVITRYFNVALICLSGRTILLIIPDCFFQSSWCSYTPCCNPQDST